MPKRINNFFGSKNRDLSDDSNTINFLKTRESDNATDFTLAMLSHF